MVILGKNGWLSLNVSLDPKSWASCYFAYLTIVVSEYKRPNLANVFFSIAAPLQYQLPAIPFRQSAVPHLCDTETFNWHLKTVLSVGVFVDLVQLLSSVIVSQKCVWETQMVYFM